MSNFQYLNKEKYLFYRKMERRLDLPHQKGTNFDAPVYSCLSGFKETTRISEAIHSMFNFEACDVCAWPSSHITKEEVDRLWLHGQRSFSFLQGCHEVMLYDVRFMSFEEYKQFEEELKQTKEKLINHQLLKIAQIILEEYHVKKCDDEDNPAENVTKEEIISLIQGIIKA
jgi:hypothetical protein